MEDNRTIQSESSATAPVLFCFGCRSEDSDFLYKVFWVLHSQNGGMLSEAKGGGLLLHSQQISYRRCGGRVNLSWNRWMSQLIFMWEWRDSSQWEIQGDQTQKQERWYWAQKHSHIRFPKLVSSSNTNVQQWRTGRFLSGTLFLSLCVSFPIFLNPFHYGVFPFYRDVSNGHAMIGALLCQTSYSLLES